MSCRILREKIVHVIIAAIVIGISYALQGCEVQITEGGGSGTSAGNGGGDGEGDGTSAGNGGGDGAGDGAGGRAGDGASDEGVDGGGVQDTGKSIKVMSYNTKYNGYPCCGGGEWQVQKFGETVVDVAPAVVGFQEVQAEEMLKRYSSGYEVATPGKSNQIFYNPSKVTYAGVMGSFSIPKDDYADRYFTYAKFKLGNTVFWHFNTHMPHKANEASSGDAHSKIAQMVVDKRRELGAGSVPTVITGDFNPHYNWSPSFEDTITRNGFTRAYEGTGKNGGFGHLDRIYYSTTHWTASDGNDGPTGGSDHPSIYATLTLK